MTLRSILMVTPSSDEALGRAATSGADALMVDLADADAAAFLRTSAFLAGMPASAVYLRVGPLADERTIAAIDALVPARPTGFALAGAAGGADVTRLAALLRPREAMAGIDDGATGIIALATDTAAGLLALGTYAGSSLRLAALAWDDEALGRTMDAEDVTEVARSARTGVLIAAAAAGIAALDRPFRGRNLAALRDEAQAARRAGFAGKIVLAPDQVGVVNAAFTRSAATNS